MRSRLAAVAAPCTLLALLLAGCANPNLSDDVDALVAELRDLPGVTSADADYSEPVTLDSGKVALKVEAEPDVTSEQLQEVGRVVYEAFSTTHEGEEGDVDVTFGPSTVHLRSFEPEATTDAVVQEWALAHDVAQDGAAAVDIMTQDVPGPDHVETDVVLTLGKDTGADDVSVALDRLEQEHGADDARRGWGVAAADGSSVSADRGFPGDGTMEAWAALRSAAEPAEAVGRVGVGMREFAEKDADPDRYVVVQVSSDGTAPDLDDPAVRGPLLEAVRAQVDLLVDGTSTWNLRLEVGGTVAAELDPMLCEPGSAPTGPLEEELRDDRTCPGP